MLRLSSSANGFSNSCESRDNKNQCNLGDILMQVREKWMLSTSMYACVLLLFIEYFATVALVHRLK